MDTGRLTSKVDELIKLGMSVLATQSETRSGRLLVDLTLFYQFRSASISFILKLFGNQHPYYSGFDEKVSDAMPSTTKRGIGILNAVKVEIEQGWLISTKGLISADIFGDFLEMADHLLSEGYKDPAAVLTGSSLEQHLKNMCESQGIDITVEKNRKSHPKKADVLNADLTKAGVLSKLDQKSVTFWLGLRNYAAHGDFEKYNEDQVKLMISSVSEFMARTADEL
jgi:hypothetical protein